MLYKINTIETSLLIWYYNILTQISNVINIKKKLQFIETDR